MAKATSNSLTVNEKIKIVRVFSANGGNSEATRKQLYHEGIRDGKWGKVGLERADLPSRGTIIRINDTFDETGCVDRTLLKSTLKRKKQVKTVENLQKVKDEVLKSPDISKSHRRLSAILGISPSSIYQILKELKLKPYIPRRAQKLNEDDHDRRLEFCEVWIGMLDTDPTFPENILWSDEAKFHLNGAVNRHNCVYWREEPVEYSVEKTATSKGVNVWCGLHRRGIIGPVFIEDNLNAENYRQILINHVIPFIDAEFEEIVFQQDGAPCHYANVVRNLLNENLTAGWIGRRGTIEGPPRSPDLSPLDFFFWGIMKDRVYKEKIRDLTHLQEIIKREALLIAEDTDLLKKVCLSVTPRIKECIEANGGHFEQFR